jgi:hypothetical protein
MNRVRGLQEQLDPETPTKSLGLCFSLCIGPILSCWAFRWEMRTDKSRIIPPHLVTQYKERSSF